MGGWQRDDSAAFIELSTFSFQTSNVGILLLCTVSCQNNTAESVITKTPWEKLFKKKLSSVIRCESHTVYWTDGECNLSFTFVFLQGDQGLPGPRGQPGEPGGPGGNVCNLQQHNHQ